MPPRRRGPLFIALAAVATSGVACGLDLVGAPAAEDIAPPGFDGSDDGSSADTAFFETAPGDSQPGNESSTDAGDAGDASDSDSGLCPALCTDCNGGRCNIVCPGPKCTSPINCSPGLPCRIFCTVKDACKNKTINCATAESCRVDCAQDNGCNATILNATQASSLCVVCDGNAASPGCNNMVCNDPAACGRSCGAGGMACKNSCPQCTSQVPGCN
jgi:hypothetical protein